MAKQLNVSLQIQADTAQAKQALMNLTKTLDEIIGTRTITVEDTSINAAKQAAIDLKHHLDAAINVNTGKLDLSKFSASLNKSGQSLKTLYADLSKIGPQGQNAFLSLSQSIAKADASAISLGGKLGSLMTVLKNTARWQISSSILHGFMGSIQGAYRYAQDLNESLNNIRIVTGQNEEQMARFAREANNAAKSLSTTTTEYTNASLIYYQQGLSDEEVKARTDATIKLANVSRQSAEEVSDQMTAVWNNFAEGSDNLEYYIDVMAKLGATTASSTQEISTGLEKFAAVAKTVGLSYEYATAALATVTAKTRQSADVVGTAFKTLFARLQDLELGDTLEDGTTLGKYSAALNAVGVNIKNINGEVKDMDVILDELGSKWNTIAKDQQIALAQTVAGTRQYTQLIALMDNWDFMQENLETAAGASGELDRQAEIYAESWEAARDRVRAAAEEIYSQLVNDDAFIDILNGFEKFLNLISNVIDGLGGLKGILLLIGSIFMQQYAKEMPAFINKMITSLGILTGAAEKQRQAMLQNSNEILAGMDGGASKGLSAQITGMQKVSEMYTELAAKRKTLSSAEIAAYEQKIKDVEMYGQIAQAIGQEIDKLEEKINLQKKDVSLQLGANKGVLSQDQIDQSNNGIRVAQVDMIDEAQAKTDSLIAKYAALSDADKKSDIGKKLLDNFTKAATEVDRLKNKLSGKDIFNAFENTAKSVGKMSIALDTAKGKTEQWKKQLNSVGKSSNTKEMINEMKLYANKLEEAGINVEDLKTELDKVKDGDSFDPLIEKFKEITSGTDLENLNGKLGVLKQALIDLGADPEALRQLEESFKTGARSTEQYNVALKELEAQQKGTLTHGVKMSEVFTQIGSTMMQVSMAINAIKNIGNIWSDKDMSTGEKILQTMTAMGTLLPTLVGLYKTFTTIKAKHTTTTGADAAASTADAGAKTAEAGATTGATVAQEAFNTAMKSNPIGGVIIAITALTAALGILVTVLMAVANAETEEEAALRKANEAMEEAKQAAEDTKSAYESLKNAVSNYDDAINALEKCTKGTQEWRDAFQEVLDKTYELIQTYPQLLKYENLFNSDGTLNQDKLQEAVTDAAAAANAAQIRLTRAQTQVQLAQTALKRSNLNQSVKSDIENGYYYTSKHNSQDVRSSAYGGQENQNQTITARDLTDQVLNVLQSSDVNYADPEAIKQFVKEQIAGQVAESDLDEAVENISNAIIPLSDQFKDLANESKGTALALNNASKLIANSFFGEKLQQDPTKELAYTQALNAFNEKLQTETYSKGLDYIAKHHAGTSDTYSNMIDDNGGKIVAEAMEAYIEAAAKEGWTLSKDNMIEWDDVGFFDGNHEKGNEEYLVFKDESGKEQRVRADLVMDTAREYELQKHKDEIIANGNKIYEQQNYDEAILRYLTDMNYNGAKIGEVQNLKISEQGLENIIGNDDEIKKFLANKWGMDVEEISDTMLNDFKSGYQEQMDVALAELDKVPKFIQNKMGSELINSLNVDAVAKVGDMYTKALANGGESGINLLNNIVEKSGDSADEVMTALSEMDITSMSAEEVNEALKKLNINFELTENQVYVLGKILSDTSKVTVEEAQKTYKEISSILSNLKQEGDTIEQEAYDKLLKLNPALSSYFTMMADGTYMLTGAAEDFRRAVQSSQIEQMRQAQRNQAETAMAYTSLQGENFNQITEAKDKINQIVNQTVAEVAKNADKVIGLGFRTREEMIDFAINKGEINEEDYWNTYGSTTNAQLRILKDNGVDTKDWQASIEAGENLVDVIFDVNNAYEDWNKSIDENDFAKKASEASAEVVKLNEAIKMAQYQNDLTNAGLDYETTENYAKILQEVSEEEDFNIDKARQLAIANQRLDRGLNSLNDNFEDWAKSLKKTGKNTAEYSETIKSVRESFADMLNISSGDNLSIEWIEGLMKDSERMKKILAGDQEALEQFRQEALDQLIDNSDIDNGLQNILSTISQLEEVNPNVEWINNLRQYIGDAQLSADGLKDAMRNLGEGATLSPEYTAALNAMLASGQMTEQQLNDIFASIGYKPKVTTGFVSQLTKIPIYETREWWEPDGGINEPIYDSQGNETGSIVKSNYVKKSITTQKDYVEMNQDVPVVQIEGDSNGAGKIDIVNAGAQRITPSHGTTSSGKSGGKSGGGGSKAKEPTKKETKNPTDEKDRYHVIKEQLDDLSQAYDRVNKAKDRAFGANKLAGLKAEQKILKEQIDAQDEYLRQIKEMGKYDVNNLQHGKEKGFAIDGEWYATGGLSYYGLDAQFDENGVLTNYDQIVEAAVAKYNEAVAYYNSLTGEQQENDKSLEFAEKQYSSFMELLEQYEETNNLLQDEVDKRQELFYQWQDNNYEDLSYEIELKLKINEDELKWLEYQLKKIGDNVYKTSEAIANLFSSEGSSQASVAVQTMDDLLAHMDKLDEAYAKGEISEADYFAGLEQTRDGMYEQLEALMAIDKQMEEYYSNTLSKINEELDKFTDRMRHNIDVVNHMKDILELSGRGQDYEAMGSLLNANMQQTGDVYQTSKERYEMMLAQEKEAEAKLQEAMEKGGKEEQEIAQKNYDAAIAARQEAENTMYEDWKAHLEACNAVLENELNKTKKAWDDIYTDGQGWDYLEQTMDLAQRIGDKYLTKTNQLYETNKMLRTVQQDMDKTTNKAAQQKLNNFAKEIQNLQQIGKLSKDNLEIVKAQYEVLKAEIALEEAQNAKSTVRLQRDNEGNYGYVYTADQDKVEDAKQQLEDRRNDLYNLALEQENKNAQDIFQINKEKNEALDALNRQYYIDKTITEEEYNQRSQEIQQKYNDLLLAATKDHLVAREILNQESITGENDSWTAEFKDLVSKNYAYINQQDKYWKLGFKNITSARGKWFKQEGPKWDEFYGKIMSGAEGTQTKWSSELTKMKTNTKTAMTTFNNAVGVDEKSGVRGTLLNLDTKLEEVTTATGDLKDKLTGEDGLIEKLGEEASGVQGSTAEWGKYYDKLKGQGGVISAVEEAITKINELIKAASTNASATYTTTYVRVGSPEPNMKDQSATYTTYYKTSGDSGGNNAGSNGNNNPSSGNPNPDKGNKIVDKIKYAQIPHNEALHSKTTYFKWSKTNESAGSKFEKESHRWKTGPGGKSICLDCGLEITDNPMGFASGGYTGDWMNGSNSTSNGKLALLHEKELVLNEDDTKNMLQTVSLVREISQILDLQAGVASLSTGISPASIWDNTQTLEQMVTIHAEFPNAINHTEIEEAFDTLVNRASQYAGRPRK